MLHVLRFMFWGFGLACIAWAIKLLSSDHKVVVPETLVSRIRNSGF